MKLTDRERRALTMLRNLDAQQRANILATIERAAIANEIVTRAGRRAGALKRVRTTPDHKIVKAFGAIPALARRRPGSQD